jgi:hypothetical protein
MAATFTNYSGGTFLGDLVTKPQFRDYVNQEIYERCSWIQSGVVTRNAALDARDGGVRVEVPFFKPVTESETTIGSSASWNTNGYLVPDNITAGSQIATILHRGGAFAADDLSKLGSGADPMQAVAGYMTKTILKLRSKTLLAMMNGIFGSALSGNCVDVSQATSGAAEANYLSAANVIKAQNVLGERGDELDVIAVHSHVANYLRQIGALTFSTSALSTGGAITWGGGGLGAQAEPSLFMGLRVIVDDLLVPTINASGADQYPCFLLGSGAINEGVQQETRYEYERNILSKQSVMSWDHHYCFHLGGVSWNSSSDNPENSALSTNSNWALRYTDARLVPAVKLMVNSPFAANV